MLYSFVNNEKTLAYPGGNGMCPSCGEETLAKCGHIKTWHWSHVIGSDCDSWSEGESEWHKTWKSLFDVNQTEVVIENDGKIHRADIVANNGYVIELQHSPIPTMDMTARELFYRRMVWVIDASDAWLNGRIDFTEIHLGGVKFNYEKICKLALRYPESEHIPHYCYKLKFVDAIIWRHFPKTWDFARCNIYLDIGSTKVLYLVKKVIPDSKPVMLTISRVDKSEFVKRAGGHC